MYLDSPIFKSKCQETSLGRYYDTSLCQLQLCIYEMLNWLMLGLHFTTSSETSEKLTYQIKVLWQQFKSFIFQPCEQDRRRKRLDNFISSKKCQHLRSVSPDNGTKSNNFHQDSHVRKYLFMHENCLSGTVTVTLYTQTVTCMYKLSKHRVSSTFIVTQRKDV